MHVDKPLAPPVSRVVACRNRSLLSETCRTIAVGDTYKFEALRDQIVNIIDRRGADRVGMCLRRCVVSYADLVEDVVADVITLVIRALGNIHVIQRILPCLTGICTCITRYTEAFRMIDIVADSLIDPDIRTALHLESDSRFCSRRTESGEKLVAVVDECVGINSIHQLGHGKIPIDLIMHDPRSGGAAIDGDPGVSVVIGKDGSIRILPAVEGMDHSIISVFFIGKLVGNGVSVASVEGSVDQRHTLLRPIIQGEGDVLPAAILVLAGIGHRDLEPDVLSFLHGLGALDRIGACCIRIYVFGNAVC